MREQLRRAIEKRERERQEAAWLKRCDEELARSRRAFDRMVREHNEKVAAAKRDRDR